MTVFNDYVSTYFFSDEDGNRQVIKAYTVDGAFNIARRLYRSTPFVLESVSQHKTRIL